MLGGWNVETGVWRSRKGRARDGMHNPTEGRFPVGAADKKRSFARNDMKLGAPK